MSVTDWSPQPSGNAVADRAIPARDGMASREVPEAIRGLMAKAAALALDQGGALVSSGADNVYVLSTNSGIATLRPGIALSFWADRENTGEPFLNVDGTGPRRWLSADGLPLPAGAIQGGILYSISWAPALPGIAPGWRLVGALVKTSLLSVARFSAADGNLAEGQTVLAVPGGYTPGLLMVFRNGVILQNTDYTATNGTGITLKGAARPDDIIDVKGFRVGGVADAAPARHQHELPEVLGLAAALAGKLDRTLLTTASAPSIGEIPDGTIRVAKNATTGRISLFVNDGGTIVDIINGQEF